MRKIICWLKGKHKDEPLDFTVYQPNSPVVPPWTVVYSYKCKVCGRVRESSQDI